MRQYLINKFGRGNPNFLNDSNTMLTPVVIPESDLEKLLQPPPQRQNQAA